MVSTIYIAKNVYGGDGLGRLGDGRVAFVPGAFKGEQVKAEIVEEKRGYVKTRLVEVVEPSPERIGVLPLPQPGMVYANISRRGELEAKGAQLAEIFDRARIRVNIKGPMAEVSSTGLNYRNKVVYHFAKDKGKWLLGYMSEPDHMVVDVLDDPLARPEINAALPEIRRKVMMLLTQGASSVRKEVERKGNLTIRWSKSSGVKWWVGAAQPDVVMKEISCGKAFEVPADGFWQVNPVMGEALVREVVLEYGKLGDAVDNILDLYCGVGVFGLCCNPKKLVGVESGRRAVEFACKNAAAQGFANARFFAQEVARNLRKLRIDGKTAVILDPPRGGLEKGVPQFLAKSPAPCIMYVSCDPATLVRDLRQMGGNYEVCTVKWFDLFPRTARFETLAILRRRS